MSFVPVVRECISEKFIVASDGGHLMLTESKKDAKCRQVHLNAQKLGTGDLPLLLELDLQEKGLDIHPLFKGQANAGLKKRCDYVILCAYEGKTYVLIIELKSDKPGDWHDQCVAGECMINYVLTTIDRNKEENYRSNFEYRHILFTSNSNLVHKRHTGNKPIRYRYNRKRDVHYTIQSCSSSASDEHKLKLFLVDKEPLPS